MPHDQPPPRPHLAPPFSRPTHPGSLAPISPVSPAARPLRPTPYASAVIPATTAAATAAAAPESLSEERETATMGAAGGSMRMAPSVAARTGLSLRDLPGGHDHPGGVPANPEPAVEAVDSVFDYPTESVGSSDAVYGTGAASAEWELPGATSSRQVSAERSPARQRQSGAGAEPEVVQPRQASELARGAAETLERLAEAIRRDEVVLPSGIPWPQTAPAVLAAVLTSLLARSAGDDGAAWEASTSEPNP